MLQGLPQRLTVIFCLCGAVFAQSSGVWLDVPFVHQEKDGCGAAVIAMLMEYWQSSNHALTTHRFILWRSSAASIRRRRMESTPLIWNAICNTRAFVLSPFRAIGSC